MFASDLSSKRRAVGHACAAWLAMGLMCMTSHASAADGDRSQEQVRRLKQQLRQVQQQQEAAVAEAQTRAASEKATLSKTLQAAQGEAAAQRQAAGVAARRLQALTAEIDALKAGLAAKEAELEQLKHGAQTLRAQAEAEQSKAQAALASATQRQQQTAQALGQCRSHNGELVELGQELLQRYDDKGLLDMFSGTEPFLQAGRVKLENARAAYQDKIDALKLLPPTAAGLAP